MLPVLVAVRLSGDQHRQHATSLGGLHSGGKVSSCCQEAMADCSAAASVGGEGWREKLAWPPRRACARPFGHRGRDRRVEGPPRWAEGCQQPGEKVSACHQTISDAAAAACVTVRQGMVMSLPCCPGGSHPPLRTPTGQLESPGAGSVSCWIKDWREKGKRTQIVEGTADSNRR
jgi:hypothetical protein